MTRSKIQVPKADADFLRKNYRTKSVPVMAKELKRASATVYGFMQELGLEPLARKIHSNHPFKRQNRKLETMLKGFRIANEGRKYER